MIETKLHYDNGDVKKIENLNYNEQRELLKTLAVSRDNLKYQALLHFILIAIIIASMLLFKPSLWISIVTIAITLFVLYRLIMIIINQMALKKTIEHVSMIKNQIKGEIK